MVGAGVHRRRLRSIKPGGRDRPGQRCAVGSPWGASQGRRPPCGRLRDGAVGLAWYGPMALFPAAATPESDGVFEDAGGASTVIGMRRVGVAASCAVLLSLVMTGTAAAGRVAAGGAGEGAGAAGTYSAWPVALAAAGCPVAPYGVHRHAPGAGKTIALTFDDGPGKSTGAIPSVLATYQVPATFFNLGENIAIRSNVMRTEATRGYAMGNHTWDHPNMIQLSERVRPPRSTAPRPSRRPSPAPSCAFRPPYGNANATTLRLAQQRRMKVWLWSVDTEDWKARGSASSYWVQRIVRLAEQEGGALSHPVVLMHNQPAGNPATVAALPTIIKYFRSHGYRFVKL